MLSDKTNNYTAEIFQYKYVVIFLKSFFLDLSQAAVSQLSHYNAMQGGDRWKYTVQDM